MLSSSTGDLAQEGTQHRWFTRDDTQFCGAGQLLEQPLQSAGIFGIRAAPMPAQANRRATARVAGATAGIVRADAGVDVGAEACVQALVTTDDHVDAPPARAHLPGAVHHGSARHDAADIIDPVAHAGGHDGCAVHPGRADDDGIRSLAD